MDAVKDRSSRHVSRSATGAVADEPFSTSYKKAKSSRKGEKEDQMDSEELVRPNVMLLRLQTSICNSAWKISESSGYR